jgi:hypothetical protein
MYRIVGEILNIPPKKLVEKLIHLYPDLKHKPRVIGYDIELEKKDLTLHINTYDEKEYNIDALLLCDKEELLLFLENLKGQLELLNVAFDLIYFEEDDDGEQTSSDCLYWRKMLK